MLPAARFNFAGSSGCAQSMYSGALQFTQYTLNKMDPRKLPANDLAKLCCDAGNLAAWNEFIHRFQSHIALAVRRKAQKWGGASPEIVEELVQDVFVRLCDDDCKVLRKFEPTKEDSIFGYLIVVARNVAHNYFRARIAQRAGGELAALETEDGNLDFIADRLTLANSAEWPLRRAEIDHVLRSLIPDHMTERDYAIFWMFYEQGYTAREIASIPLFKLGLKGVESSLFRMIKMLRKDMT